MGIFLVRNYPKIERYVTDTASYVKNKASAAAFDVFHTCSNFTSNVGSKTLFTFNKIKSLMFLGCCSRRRRVSNMAGPRISDASEEVFQPRSALDNAALANKPLKPACTDSSANSVALNIFSQQSAASCSSSSQSSFPLHHLILPVPSHIHSNPSSDPSLGSHIDFSLPVLLALPPRSQNNSNAISQAPLPRAASFHNLDVIERPNSAPFGSPPPPRIVVRADALQGPRHMNACPGFTNVLTDPGIIAQSLRSAETSRGEDLHDNLMDVTQSYFSFCNALGIIALNIIWILKVFENIEVKANIYAFIEKITVIMGLLASLIEIIIEICQLRRVVHLFRDPVFKISDMLQKLESLQNQNIDGQLLLLQKLLEQIQNQQANLSKEKNIEIAQKNQEKLQQVSQIISLYIQGLTSYRNNSNSPPNFKLFQAKILYLLLKKFDDHRLRPTTQDVLNIQASLQLPSHQEAEKEATTRRVNNLSKKIGRECTDLLQREMNPILEGLRSDNENVRNNAILQAKDIINDLDIQCRKAIIVHIVAIACLLVVVAGLGLAFGAFFNPFILPATLALLPTYLFWGGFLGLSIKYCFARGFLATRGWKFSLQKATEDPIEKVKYVASCIIYPFTYAWAKLSRPPENAHPQQRARSLSV